MEFQTAGEATLKARAPKAVDTDGEWSLCWFDERSTRGGLYRAIVLDRYEGCWRVNSLKASKATLKSILCFIGNQCNSCRSWDDGVLKVWEFVTTLASEFWSRWSSSMLSLSIYIGKTGRSGAYNWQAKTLVHLKMCNMIDNRWQFELSGPLATKVEVGMA